jgi:hypothetical protein
MQNNISGAINFSTEGYFNYVCTYMNFIFSSLDYNTIIISSWKLHLYPETK